MKEKPAPAYFGPLSTKHVADGMNAAVRNAARLYEDAKTLHEAGRYPSACSLAILSIEEAGKMNILRTISAQTDPKALKAAWKDYRSHRAKNASWIIAELYKQGARKLTDLAPMFDKDSDHTQLLDTVKQLGFYSDCLGEVHWSEPEKVIDEALSSQILFVAKVLRPKREVSEREMELWAHHVAQHWGTPKMMQGAMDFQLAMTREGLSDHSPEKIAEFFGLKPPLKH